MHIHVGVYRILLLTFTNWIDLFHSMKLYEEFNNQITARGDTVAHNKAREACWQKIADCVNLYK